MYKKNDFLELSGVIAQRHNIWLSARYFGIIWNS